MKNTSRHKTKPGAFLENGFHFRAVSSLIVLIIILAMLSSVALATETGNITEHKAYPISSPVSSGIIKTVAVQEGQKVKKGDLLFEFDERLINSNLEEARAILRMEKLKAAEAKKEVERSEELYERTVLSDYALQQSKIEYSKALASLAQAKNKLAHAQWDKDYSKVYAPFPGKVNKILCYSGCYINNNVSTQVILLLEKE